MFDFGWQAWTLLGGGLLVVMIEILIPSGGLLGLLAGTCLVFGGWFAVRTGGMSTLTGYVLFTLFMAPIAALVALKLLPHTPMGRRMRLVGPELSQAVGGTSALLAYVGKEGVAETSLRPSGIAMIAGERLHVVTRGSHLEAGATVVVLKVEGNHVIVEALRS